MPPASVSIFAFTRSPAVVVLMHWRSLSHVMLHKNLVLNKRHFNSILILSFLTGLPWGGWVFPGSFPEFPGFASNPDLPAGPPAFAFALVSSVAGGFAGGGAWEEGCGTALGFGRGSPPAKVELVTFWRKETQQVTAKSNFLATSLN